jgi:cell division protein ZapA
MAQVTVRVGGYSHPVSCEDGQERHLAELAAEVDKRVASIKAMGGQFGESRLLLLAALLLADEVHDLKLALEQAHPSPATAPAAADDPKLAERLARIAERIEGIAQGLDRA